MNLKRSLIALVLTVISVLPAITQAPTDAAYYPLAPNSVWTYEVRYLLPKRPSASVLWTVSGPTTKSGRTVYQVRPNPAQGNETLQLSVTPQGILDVTENVYVLRFPVSRGDKWAQTPTGSHRLRSFYVRSANQPCRVRGASFPSCAIVEEDDAATEMKTVTTYARGTGPVLYEYYRKPSGKDVLVQSMSLVAYRSAETAGR